MDYVELLLEVLPKEAVAGPKPSLTFDHRGWWFGSEWFGTDEQAAKEARDAYYDADDLKNVL